eukprot:CAMPEP_0169237392 /NCGR_PEP_ID=MMETSP1016-20121227/29782_1 /TAXON_ID=342587 /ORGANISM="Karlodinium micrum, Strain CCMP2283" /LENGTH=166 /DNA_ID=CAMNT_0009317113 /DNA_START=65 /DNA_END=565 /DNA_ORIENTATION=-
MVIARIAILCLSGVAARRVQTVNQIDVQQARSSPETKRPTKPLASTLSSPASPREEQVSSNSQSARGLESEARSAIKHTGRHSFSGQASELHRRRIKILGLTVVALFAMVGCAVLMGSCRRINEEEGILEDADVRPKPPGVRSKSIFISMFVSVANWCGTELSFED